MKVVIPTNRPDRVKTTKFFPDAELFVNDFNNVSKARNGILDKYPNQTILMLDDDLLGLKQKVNWKYENTKDTEAMFEYHLGLMKRYNCPIMGVGSPVQGFRAKNEVKFFGRMFSAYYIDTAMFAKYNLRFDEVIANIEDFDMAMQVFDKGLIPIVTYRYTMDFDHWAKGGCNNYRTAELQKVTTQKFIQKWKRYSKYIKAVVNPVSHMTEPRVSFAKLISNRQKL